jgi:hypothetical protein
MFTERAVAAQIITQAEADEAKAKYEELNK